MEQKTIHITMEHNRADVMHEAHKALDELTNSGVTTFYPLEMISKSVERCEVLRDDLGRQWRTVTTFNMETGLLNTRIDIRYEKPGAAV
jgi:hypothetical protein